MNKLIMIESYIGILLSSKKESAVGIHDNIAESQNKLNERSQTKKPSQCTLYNSVYITC